MVEWNMVDVKKNDNNNYMLVIRKCDRCNGVIGIDITYLQQVSDEIDCPYCGETNAIDC